MPRRLPVRLLTVPVVLALAAACSSGSDAAESPAAESPAAALALFDSATVHSVDVTFDEEDYDAMIETFVDTGEKEWIEADVVIDGVSYEQVGLRLKGNSSLAGLGGGFGGRREAGDTGDTGDAAPQDDRDDRGEGPGGSASAEDPESLPWLIRLDEFVDGQDHQGYEDLVVRSNRTETSLNEAVALDLLEEVGLASQEAASTSFRVNGGDAVLRLVIEHPDDDAWQEENFETAGALYKAESTGDWSYRGDDPADYDEAFDQEGGEDVADLTPLIELLEFVNESDDETFAADLAERLDVEAFATYLAMMDLLGNFDDIDGPGNNAYLWYDAETERFTVVPWDMNLALDGGGGRGEGDRAGGFGPPNGVQPPEGVEPPDGAEAASGRRGGRFGGSNILVERFHADTQFEAIYQQQLTSLRASLYDSGVAGDILASWVDLLTDEAADLVAPSTVAEEAEAIAQRFEAEASGA